jgi:two-component system, NtrC family, sensor histidine kinase PilS
LLFCKKERKYPIMNIESTSEDINKRRLLFLVISRLAIITLFLGVAIFIDIQKPGISIFPMVLRALYAIIAVTYFFSIIYFVLLRSLKYFKFNIYLQLVVDVCLITVLVYITGSLRSNYSLLYTLVIIYSVIFLERKGGLIVASASGIFYGLLLDLEYFQWIPRISSTDFDYHLTPEEVFFRILVHMVSFYILAFLASFVVEQEKKTRSLLEEKESAFDQLDLLFRSIIESVDTGVMTINLAGRIKTFNRAAEDITGFSLPEVENKRIEDLFPEFITSLSEGDVQEHPKSRMEVVITGKKAKRINVGCSISHLKDKKEKQIGNILIFQDLTEIKKMEDNLEKSKRLALIGEMAAGLAHEMRNPLASIAGSVELLKQGINLEETDNRLMQIILRGKDQLESFVRDFLLLARPIPVKREVVDINDITDDVIENMKLSPFWSNKIKVVRLFDKKVNAVSNKEHIRQIIHNLLLNAIQAMNDIGTLTIKNTIRKLDDKNEYAEINITDNGCGIEENNLQKIFEPFFTNKDKGTGLGLTIVGRLVDGYGGKIKFVSKVDKGTTCTVWLPAVSKDKL